MSWGYILPFLESPSLVLWAFALGAKLELTAKRLSLPENPACCRKIVLKFAGV